LIFTLFVSDGEVSIVGLISGDVLDDGGDLGADEGKIVEILVGKGFLVDAVVDVDDAIDAGGGEDGGGHGGLDVGQAGDFIVIGLLEVVSEIGQEDVIFVVEGLFDDVLAEQGFEGDLVAAAGAAAVTSQRAGGGFAEAGPDVIGVKLVDEYLGQLGEEFLLIALFGDGKVEIIEVLEPLGIDVQGFGVLAGHFIDGGGFDLGIYKGVFQVDGGGLGMEVRLGVKVDLERKIGDSDNITFVKRHFGDGTAVDGSTIGGFKVLDHPYPVGGCVNDGVLAGDVAVG
jgi:hypothetical protein